MKQIIITVILFFYTLIGYSQTTFSIGGRVGNFVGVDYKQYFSYKQDFALQLILNQKEKSAAKGSLTRLTGFIVYNQTLQKASRDVPSFTFFYGFGGHIGEDYNNSLTHERIGHSKLEAGLDATFGFETTFSIIPLVLAVDFSPYYNMKDIEDENYWLNMGASLRYIFGKKRR